MQRIFILLVLTSLFGLESSAQFTRYLVKLKNKAGTPYTFSNPSAYLSNKAIARRTRYGIAIDSTDLPVTPAYITQISNVPNVTVLNASKWLNQVSIQTTDANAITTISGLPFVQSVSGLAAKTSATERSRNKFELEENVVEAGNQRTERTTADFFNYGTNSFNEIHLHNGEFLHNIGLRGQGVTIAMLDAGYFNYTGLKAFDSVNQNGQILSTWDFVARHASVAEDNSHGMQCLSTIAANIPGQFIGKAPKASFHLFRTEDVASEYPIEEHNWVCGAERADSVGSDVISSSLGYYDFDNPVFNYTYNDMNGRTTITARGAAIGARKGMLIVNAVGNEGGVPWKYLITPSDGDSVLAVGAVNVSGIVGAFSSYGPSSDGQVKPDVASIGVSAMVQSTANSVVFSNGTSFACPNMAGLATCLWQGFPEFNSIKIIRAMQMSSNRFAVPDDRTGYGIPNMKFAFSSLLTEYATATASFNNCEVTLNWSSKDMSAMKYEVERKMPGETVYTKIANILPQNVNVLVNHNYQYINTLQNLPTGNYSYRIRQVIDTNSATFLAIYINAADVNVNTSCIPQITEDKVSIQPNPPTQGSSVAQLVVETSYQVDKMYVAIFDMKGNRVYQLQSNKTIGRKTIDLPIGVLPSGRYVVKVYNGKEAIGTADLLKL